jgi:cytochrome c oxidase cbb3-type subunit III
MILALLLFTLAGRLEAEPSVSGRAIFQSHCSSCHGLDGRGGERAPDVVTNPAVSSLSDQALTNIIEHGVPRAGMPGFKAWLTPQETRAVVAFIRSTSRGHGRPKLAGSSAQGKILFFGKAGCAECHMVNGQGGFLGGDLTDYGRHHSQLQAQQAILHPDRSPGQPTVTVVTKKRQEWSGALRNEDNFSIQLLDSQGVFHLVMKSDLVRVKREARPAMPRDYASRLAAEEINNLAMFLAGRDLRRQPDQIFR